MLTGYALSPSSTPPSGYGDELAFTFHLPYVSVFSKSNTPAYQMILVLAVLCSVRSLHTTSTYVIASMLFYRFFTW